MQFQTIIATLAIAMTATAAPAPAPNGGSGWGVPGQNAQNQCSANQTASCCNGVAGLIGIECVALNLVQLISSQCSQQQIVTCCNQGNVVQGGLINLNAQCLPITVL